MALGHGAEGGEVVELCSKDAAEGVADFKLLEHGAEAMNNEVSSRLDQRGFNH